MVKNTKIKIEKKTYILKSHSYRAMFLFEDMTDKPFGTLSTLQDQMTYIYCILKTSNEDFEYTMDEFIDILEKDDGKIVSAYTDLILTKKK